MIEVNIVCVGSLKEKYWVEAINEYNKRLKVFCNLNIIEVKEGKTCQTPAEILETKKQEAKLLEKYKKGFTIALEINGENLSSEKFAKKIKDISVQGFSVITFFIGGSNGLDEEFSNGLNYKLSFGKNTFPHQLMRVILIEQIYRCFMINNNKPYHK